MNPRHTDFFLKKKPIIQRNNTVKRIMGNHTQKYVKYNILLFKLLNDKILVLEKIVDPNF